MNVHPFCLTCGGVGWVNRGPCIDGRQAVDTCPECDKQATFQILETHEKLANKGFEYLIAVRESLRVAEAAMAELRVAVMKLEIELKEWK